MFIENKNFYPTPERIIQKMYFKLKEREKIRYILEPSAGKGDIAQYLENQNSSYSGKKFQVSCIEIDENLQSILKNKDFKVIDSDFLAYSGLDRFDAIIMNPPFSNGEYHLMKAINIMYNGQIVCLLNAETLRNPHSNVRQDLLNKLSELNADIEYISDAFKDAERKTMVDVALVYINIERSIETDLFDGCSDKSEKFNTEIKDSTELAPAGSIEFMVADYESVIQSGLKVIRSYYQNYNKINNYLGLNTQAEKGYSIGRVTLTSIVNNKINLFVKDVRADFWKKTLDLKEIKSRMTEKVREKFLIAINKQADMEFSYNNIKQFVVNLVGKYNDMLTDAVLEVFDKMTVKYHWHEECSKNTYMFNGWKTNKAYYVNKKIILPVYGGCSHPFIGWDGKWKLSEYDVDRALGDIDKVLNYFDGKKDYVTICDALKIALDSGKTSNIKSTYFTMTVYKKKTIHLTFIDENIRRRFNICACKGKNWLPPDYGKKFYNDMCSEEKEVVNSFIICKSH